MLSDTAKIALIGFDFTGEFIAGQLASDELPLPHVKADSRIGLHPYKLRRSSACSCICNKVLTGGGFMAHDLVKRPLSCALIGPVFLLGCWYRLSGRGKIAKSVLDSIEIVLQYGFIPKNIMLMSQG